MIKKELKTLLVFLLIIQSFIPLIAHANETYEDEETEVALNVDYEETEIELDFNYEETEIKFDISCRDAEAELDMIDESEVNHSEENRNIPPNTLIGNMELEPFSRNAQLPFPQSRIPLPNRRLTATERSEWISEYREMGGPFQFELEVIRLVNNERRAHGLSSVRLDTTLAMAARFYAQTMSVFGTTNNWSHNVGPYRVANASHGASRNVAEAFGGRLRWNGGNAAAGLRTPESLVQAWMNSSGHRAYILSPEHRYIGVGAHTGGPWGVFQYMFLSDTASTPSHSSVSSNHRVTRIMQTGVTRRNTSFRRGPGMNYTEINVVNGSTNVRITGRTGGWYRVITNNTTGWMRRSEVARTRQNAVVATNRAHVRTGRGSRFTSLTQISRGRRVTVTRRSANWSRITVNGHTGWVHNRNLHFGNAMRSGRTTANNVTVHTRPRAAAPVRRRLPRNTQLMIVQRTTDGWSQVRIHHSNGMLHGWVRTNQIQRRASSRQLIRDGTLRSAPNRNASHIRTIPRNTRITARSRVGNWYHVHLNINGRRQSGWLHRSNLQSLTLP